MPNRILKESIRISDDIEKLSYFEEVLFYRLIVSCDDYGLYDGRPQIIKGSCFPLKDITLDTITDGLHKLSEVGMVHLYKVHGRPYLQLVNWSSHQNIRAKRSKYPKPEEADPEETETETSENMMKTSDINCKQMNTDDIKHEQKTENVPVIQSESNHNPNPNPKGTVVPISSAKPKKKRQSSKRTVFYPNDEKLDQAFKDYADMRKKLKKPLTDKAVTMAMNKLKSLATPEGSDVMDNDLAIKILNKSTFRSWAGLFPIDEQQPRSNGNRGRIDWSNV